MNPALLRALLALVFMGIAIAGPTVALATTVVGGIGSDGSLFLGINTGGSGSCDADICDIAETVLSLINDVLVPVLFAIAFIVFLYGVAKAYIFSGGDEGAVAQGHKLILWGVIAFVVMISLWGIVNVVANTFGLSGGEAPALPTSGQSD